MFSSTIKPYKFVNPSSLRGTKGATIIAGGKKIAGAGQEDKTARTSLLAVNRLGSTIYSLGMVQKQIRDIVEIDNKYLVGRKDFARRREQYRRDQQSEAKTESLGKKEPSGEVKQETQKEVKKNQGWLEKLLGPFKGIIEFSARIIITQGILKYVADPANADKLERVITGLGKVFGFLFNVAYKSIDSLLSGFASVFGTDPNNPKTGLARFGELLGGLGQILVGIAGLAGLRYLLNPFALIDDILGLTDLLEGKGKGNKGKVEVPGGKKPTRTPAAQKIAENYGDDAARLYEDALTRKKSPVQALTEVRSRFKKLPPKPPGFFQRAGNFLSDKSAGLRKGVSGAVEGVKGFGKSVSRFGNNLKTAGQNAAGAAGNFIKEKGQKALQPIMDSAYKLLKEKGIIKMAQEFGGKAMDLIKKVPGFSKIMSKVQKAGGAAMLAKLGGKAIPIIGGLFNLYFAYDRFKNGDKTGAMLEALSAVLDIAGLVTGGTTSIASALIDAYLFGRDFFPEYIASENKLFDSMIAKVMGPLAGIQKMLPPLPFAEGGIVTKPTRALVGEAGPEAIIPLSKFSSGVDANLAATVISATQSMFSRMGASGDLAKQLIGGDLSNAAKTFGIGNIASAGGGDRLSQSKSVVKLGKEIENLSEDEQLRKMLGDKTPTVGKGEYSNTMNNLRGALANVLGVFMSIASKDFKPGSTNKNKNTNGTTSGAPPGNIDLAGNSNAEKVFRYLVDKEGFTPEAAAGIIGNLMQESGVNPKSRQLGGGPGRGIMQWTESERWASMQQWAKGKDPWALETQVQWMIKEMKSYGTYNRIKNVKDYKKAVEIFESEMEKAGTPNYPRRYAYAASAYGSFGGTKQMAKGGELKKSLPKPTFKYKPDDIRDNFIPVGSEGSFRRFASGGIYVFSTAPSGAPRLMGNGKGFSNTFGHHEGASDGRSNGNPNGPRPGGIPRDYLLSTKSNPSTPDSKGDRHPIRAGVTGTVTSVGEGWGAVQIADSSGTIFRAGHMTGIKVKVGDKINPGTIIGIQGAVGMSNGYVHAHIEAKTGALHNAWIRANSGATSTGPDTGPADSDSDVPSDGQQEEPQIDPFAQIEQAISSLNSSLFGITPTAESAKVSPTTSATSSGKALSSSSSAVQRNEESKASSGAATLVPIPINTSDNAPTVQPTIQVVQPRLPVTYGF